MAVFHLGHQAFVKEAGKESRRFTTIDQRHPGLGNAAIRIVDNSEGTFDLRKVGTQAPGESRKLGWIGRGFAAQILIPDQI